MDYKREAEKLKTEYEIDVCGRELGWCDTEKCPLWGNREGRVDGYCVTETYLHVDGFIKSYEYEILNLEMKIDTIREKISKLKSFKKKFEDYLEGKR